jgi:hypothetical protein
MTSTPPPTPSFDDSAEFSFRRMRKGAARKLLVAGAVLMCIALSTPWGTTLSSGGVTTTTYLGGGATQETRISGGTAGGGSAYARGVARYPLLLIVATLAWAAWRGAPSRRWMRYVPLGAALLLAAWGRGQAQSARREADEWRGRLSSTTISETDGPGFFLLCLVPFALGALLAAREPYPWRPAPGEAPTAG